jgi:phage tail sheath protein FI
VDLGYAVYQFLANGGRTAYVQRVVGQNASTSSIAVTYRPTGAAASAAYIVNAASPGTWGNALSVVVSAGLEAASSSQIPTFTLSVQLSGTEVERWTELSLDIGSNRYLPTVINTYSSYITITNVAAAVANASFSYVLGSSALAGGADGNAVVDADYVAALSSLDSIVGDLVFNVVGRSSSTLVSAALNYAAARGNGFALIDPDATAKTVSDIHSVIATYPSSNAGYGAVYYPMLKMYDPAKSGPAAIRDTYPGGAMAGIYIRVENERTVAKAAAGYSVDVRNALGLAVKFTDSDVGNLYSNQTYAPVNTFKVTPGAGITVNGARTLERLRPDLFIPVRRSLNYIKTRSADIAQFAVFEPNGPRLWDALKLRLGHFLTDFWQGGGLKGKSAQSAFFIVCDESNNTPITIDNGEVHVDIGVALQYPAEFIIINVAQWTGGSNTSETF